MTRFSVRTSLLAFLMFVALLGANFTPGQQVTGTILGRVTDSTGSVVPGATIQIQNAAIGFTRTETADSDGRYFSTNLPLGAYTVTVTKDGFQTLVRSGIELAVGAQVTINAELVVGNVQQHVEVTGEAPQVETTNATISDVVNPEQMRDLPLNGRNVDQLALLARYLGEPRGQLEHHHWVRASYFRQWSPPRKTCFSLTVPWSMMPHPVATVPPEKRWEWKVSWNFECSRTASARSTDEIRERLSAP